MPRDCKPPTPAPHYHASTRSCVLAGTYGGISPDARDSQSSEVVNGGVFAVRNERFPWVNAKCISSLAHDGRCKSFTAEQNLELQCRSDC